MNSTMTYEKPTMTFVSLRSEDAVAATCWGNHGKGITYYCDIPGEGYMSFQISAGSCDLNLTAVCYYNSDDEPTAYTQEQYNQLCSILSDAGGKNGNPYKGLGTTVIPDHPGSWS